MLEKIPLAGITRVCDVSESWRNQDMMRTMPTVLRIGPYRFYFYSHEPNEPPHIHIDRDSASAKFWLETVSLAKNIGFSAKELRKLQAIVQDNQEILLEAWHGYFGSSSG